MFVWICGEVNAAHANGYPTTTINASNFLLNNTNADAHYLLYDAAYSASLNTVGFQNVDLANPNTAIPNVLVINLAGNSPMPLYIYGGTPIVLGPIIDTNGINQLKLSIAPGQSVMLAGITPNSSFSATLGDYRALGEVDLNNGNGFFQARIGGQNSLNINFLNAGSARLKLTGDTVTITNPSIGTFGTIEFDGYIKLQTINGETTFFTNQWSIGQVDAFTALTPAVFTSPTIGSGFLNVGHLHIGSANTINTVTIKPTSNVDINGSGMYEAYRGNTKHYGVAGQPDSTNLGYDSGIFISRIFWENADAELVLDSSNSNSDLTFDTPGSNLINGVDINAATWGILTLNAQDHSLTVTSTSTTVGQTLRPKLITGAALKTLNINGNRNVTLDLEGYASTLNLNNPAPQILFTTPANLLNGTTASTINLYADAHLKHSIDAHGITINLNTFELDLSPNTIGDTIRLGSDLPIVLNTTFDQTSIASGKGGHLFLNDSSVLNLSAAAQGIQINFTTSNSVLPPARREFSYKVIDPGINSSITFSNTPPTFSILGTQNTYSTWNFDPDTYTIYTITDFSYLPADIAASGASPNAVAIATALVNAYNSGNNDATPALQQITTNDPRAATAALVASDMGDIATGEAGDIATLAATTRIISDENLLADSESSGVAAGSQPGRTYGVWISPFYQKARQKPHGVETGYKLVNYGGTIGADTKINDDTTLGIAITALRAHIDCSQTKIDSKANSNTGVLSFYGKTSAPRDVYLSAIGSFGISKIKSKEKRAADPTVIDYANTQYKSYFHTVSVIGSKDYGFERWRNVLVTPILGLRYAHFKDDAYTETDSLILNTSVAAKSNYGIDGILGGKIQGSYGHANGYTIMPEASAFAYLNLKHKASIMRISSSAFNDPVTLTGAKPSKAWYTLASGLTAQKDHMEYGLQYEAGFDKKYISHQVALRIRVDF